jgi:DNA-binding transcriptional LysR family regulator
VLAAGCPISHDPYKIDFAALRTLQAVHKHGSFSKAAEHAEVSQSVVSYTIDKLRSVLNDPLFLRQGGRILPTERCNEIVASAELILESYNRLIFPEAIDPANIRHRFALSCNYYEQRWILPLIARRLQQTAPMVELVIVSSGTGGPGQLLRGEADLLIGPMRPDAEGYYRRNLISEHYVCVMDHENSLAARELDLQDYVDARHVGIVYGRGWVSSYLTTLHSMGIEIVPTITLPSPAGIEDLIEGTDLIATVPKRFALSMTSGLHVTACPVAAPFEVDLVWNVQTHTSPVHQWFRNLVAEAVKAGSARCP